MKLSPSSSGRWLYCAGSIPLNQRDDSGGPSNVYAELGTAAHALLEMCQRLGVEPIKFLGTAIYKEHIVDHDMVDAVGHAMDYVRAYLGKHPKATLHIEKEVDPFAHLNCDPGYASGTPDIVLDDAALLELTCIDYKHGANNAVEVAGNTQTLQYLVGYWSQHCTRPYKTYRAVIIQPRSRHEDGPVREETYTHEQLMAHAKRLKRRVIEIRKDPTQREAGDWCDYCKGAARCGTLKAKAMELAQIEFGGSDEPVKPKELSIKELEEIWAYADVFEYWLKEVRGALLLHLQRGGKSKLAKLVRGRMGNRHWRDDKRVLEACKKLKLDVDLFMPRALVGVTDLEYALKVKGVKQIPAPLQKLIERKPGKLHVARKDDPRPAVTRGDEFNKEPE
jgi:hypothetical protein